MQVKSVAITHLKHPHGRLLYKERETTTKTLWSTETLSPLDTVLTLQKIKHKSWM